MRVITGTAKGCRLTAPAGESTRPTSSAVKEAVFSAIQFEIEGARVLDLFAGSGQMGIEALSRGAKSCVLVDEAKSCAEVIRKNLEHTRLAERARVIMSDVLRYLRSPGAEFDIAFADPPYAAGMSDKVLSALAGRMSECGVIMCEVPAGQDMPKTAGDMVLYREYLHGRTKIASYRMPGNDI